MIYFCDDLPHPTRDHEAFIEKGVERLIQVLNISQGKALVLFTAKTDMEEVYAALQSRNLPYKILIQQNGAPKNVFCRRSEMMLILSFWGLGPIGRESALRARVYPILSSSACHSRYPILLLSIRPPLPRTP